jgi:alpha-1,3-mannosyltransferase
MSEKSAILRLYKHLAAHPVYDLLFLGLLLLGELLLGWLIILKVPYTEIDWDAYMQEVSTWWDEGELDYRKIRGGTGPLVYPAGFLYLFQTLRWLTGGDVRQAQYFFWSLYVATQGVVLSILHQRVVALRNKNLHQQRSSEDDNNLFHSIWSWRIAMGVTCLSKRIHSIFLLRLFNDGPTMLLLYTSIWLFTKHRWNWGCLVFSLAVSIKMNVLLFAPGLLLLLLQSSPDLQTVVGVRLLACCALPQLLLGAPFLTTYPISYLRKAFELDRVFFYKWTVNWKVRSSCLVLDHSTLERTLHSLTHARLFSYSSCPKTCFSPNPSPSYCWGYTSRV